MIFASVAHDADAPQPVPGATYDHRIPILGAARPVAEDDRAPVVDPLGRVHRTTAADGAVTETVHEGGITRITVRDLNRPPGSGLPVSAPVTSTTTLHHDLDGRLRRVDGPFSTARYTYDLAGRLICRAADRRHRFGVYSRPCESQE